MSSSRVQTTLTGLPTAFDVSTASVTKSASPRRPNPPPRYVVKMLTLSGGRARWRPSPPGATPSVPASAPRRRTDPGARPPCSSSAPSSRARGTAPRTRVRWSSRALQGRSRVAVVARDLARLFRELGVVFHDVRAVQRGQLALVPLHVERLDALRCRPVVVGDDSDAAADADDVPNAGERPSPCRR